MSSLKEKMKVVPLTTNEKTNLLYNTYKFTPEHGNPWEFRNVIVQNAQVRGYEFKHLHIVSNREIKEGDWYLSWETNYAESPKERFVIYNLVSKPNGFNPRKIEASTYKSLGLPQPSPDFVKKYVELEGSITEIMVDMVEKYIDEDTKGNVFYELQPKIDKNNYITPQKL